MKTLLRIGLAIVALAGFTTLASANPNNVGPDACKKCHTAEHEVWEASQHFASYKEIHRNREAKDIVDAVGDRRMKKSETCQICHYTIVDGDDEAGPSCESCHSPAKEWIDVHNDKKNDNSIQDAIGKGMIHSSMIFDIASNCMGCHGLANEKLPGDKAAAMLDAGHPLKPEFELVEYSQGQVRHRFYPPDVKTNQEMTDAQKSVYYLVGQAAALVSATDAIAKTDHAKYVEAQNKRIATAKSVLEGIPEAATLLGAPTMENGRAFGEAIKGKDFSGQVTLPTKYK
ncbi:MAG: multiheme c-type cytochrome [Alphaproteobacteria bacterium]